MQTTIVCHICSSDAEHILHVFFDCDYAKRCWLKSGLVYDMREVESTPTWMLEKLCTESEEKLIIIAKTLWGICFSRNRRVWEEKQLHPESIMEFTTRQITDWKSAQRKEQHATVSLAPQ